MSTNTSNNDLRHRSVVTTTMQESYHNTNQLESLNDDNEESSPLTFPLRNRLSAKKLLDDTSTAPQHHGTVLKLHVPLLYTLIPYWLRPLVLSLCRCFLPWLRPSWKQRYLILCGSYLYKFVTRTSNQPKGSPFPIEQVDVQWIPNNTPPTAYHYASSTTMDQDMLNIAKSCLPPGYTGMFRISTLLRRHYYAVNDLDDAKEWVTTLQQAKQETITRNMGHAEHVPYPKSWAHYDSLGNDLVKSKERIKQRLQEGQQRELEMTSFSGGGMGSMSIMSAGTGPI